MILESFIIIGFALFLDFTLGDPKNKFHPTAWIGNFIATLTPFAKNQNPHYEKLLGIAIVIITVVMVSALILLLDFGISLIT